MTALTVIACALIFAGLGAAMGSTVRGISGLITGNNDTILAGGLGTLGGVAAGAFGTVGCA